MSATARRWVLLAPGLLVLLGMLLWGFTGLPGFGDQIGEYGRVINQVVQPQRHVTNFVSAVMFDYRGVDTMIEEFILFASVTGVAMLLRSNREVDEHPPHDVVTSEAVRTAGGALAPALFLFGLWVISFGYVTPGGGFQGGVLASAGALLLWLAGSYRLFQRSAPETLLDAAEGLGAAAYVGIGLITLAAGGAFLVNDLPLGSAGSLASGGSIAALNWVSGVEVTAGFLLLYREFTQEYIETFRRSGAGS